MGRQGRLYRERKRWKICDGIEIQMIQSNRLEMQSSMVEIRSRKTESPLEKWCPDDNLDRIKRRE